LVEHRPALRAKTLRLTDPALGAGHRAAGHPADRSRADPTSCPFPAIMHELLLLWTDWIQRINRLRNSCMIAGKGIGS
jgi:hypothetical protein